MIHLCVWMRAHEPAPLILLFGRTGSSLLKFTHSKHQGIASPAFWMAKKLETYTRYRLQIFSLVRLQEGEWGRGGVFE